MRGGSGDLMFLEFVVESGAADSQELGCLLFIPGAFVKNLLEQPSLVFHKA